MSPDFGSQSGDLNYGCTLALPGDLNSSESSYVVCALSGGLNSGEPSYVVWVADVARLRGHA